MNLAFLVPALAIALTGGILSGCSTADRDHKILISVPEQRMLVLERGTPVSSYPISTSKFGLGDAGGSYATPLGKLEVARKIGGGAPLGMKFKDRKPTGEIVPVNSPGRDPIVTRILWLRGLEARNQNAFARYIYIHGTAEEKNIGKPVSYGCIRMRSRDVAALYETVGVGARVEITEGPLPAQAPQAPPAPTAGTGG